MADSHKVIVKDQNIRLLVSAAIAIAVYFIMTIILNPLVVHRSGGMMAMMSFASPDYITLHIASLLIGSFSGMAFYLLAKPREAEDGKELAIIRKALSADENAVIGEVEKAGEITQDSLRFRLGWSKAKVSTILTNLDRMNLIQRERQGKTYNVFLVKKREL